MKKEYSDPFDNLLYKLSDYVSEPLHKANITPNMITLSSIIFNVFIYNLLNNKQNTLAVGFIIIRYFFDCLDGFMARKYKQYSLIGDYLDHISDVIFGLTVIYQLYRNNTYNIFKNKIIIYICFVLLMTIHLGCQEKISNNNISPSISLTKKLCIKESWVNYTRYFGPGTTIIVLCLLVIY